MVTRAFRSSVFASTNWNARIMIASLMTLALLNDSSPRTAASSPVPKCLT